ncbi:maltooligosyltrehalose trehalohydrolase [Constrictibacter sp. MBR-5]|jgi:maltooligosyltrehalose trehalohydrolase|uniref:malto-oligosyltrehalose trehalohydrolase n=1 Tax=Constrictibacter sp. MBR-5 TaxID=3156467 RepID=UPI003394C178
MQNRFIHDMRFGAHVGADGGTRFRLWAPSVEKIGIEIDGRAPIAMTQLADGWFEAKSDAAPTGSRYSFVLPDGLRVPDPASRRQAEDVHGPSMVVDPGSYVWSTRDWQGRPWEETVLYELHVGTFSAEGTFEGVRQRLDHLVDLGVTAVELMPISDFPGTRNWGYDGVLHFAPDAVYGTPDDLKRLVDEAHARGLTIFLDVVYNHFGPDGNYLNAYAAGFFDPDVHTPWGSAVNYAARPVRDFVIENALYWLREYRFDGLRFDAVDQIRDASAEHLLEELAATVRSRLTAEEPGRHVHLVLENDRNQAALLERSAGRPKYYDAQWDDDIHHVYQHLASGEAGGYYADYADHAVERLGKALATGFVYQGDPSAYRHGEIRGEPSGHLPPTSFVAFIQNHDQVGNRAFGERIDMLAGTAELHALTSIYLLAPQIPLIFMGEEWGSRRPFLFFTDFHDELADAVREGRRREFARFPQFADPVARAHIPDPNDPSTFATSKLDWDERATDPHDGRLAHVKELLRLRRDRIVPLLRGANADGQGGGSFSVEGMNGLQVSWRLPGGALTLTANLSPDEWSRSSPADDPGELLYESRPGTADALSGGRPVAPWSVAWMVRR